MKKILYYDLEENKYTEYLRSIANESFNIIFITTRYNISSSNGFNVINIYDYNYDKESGEELQKKYNFSLYRIAAADRIMTNYTNYTNCEKYSDYSYKNIEELIYRYAIVLDKIIPDVDYVVTNSADNFRALLFANIAKFYDKIYFGFYNLYWYNNGMLPIDTVEQTSSLVKKNYFKYYNSSDSKFSDIEDLFKNKKFNWHFEDSYKYPILKRILLLLNRNKSYNKISIKNWIERKFKSKYSCFKERYFLKYHKEFYYNEKFVLFPLHVAPEASLLGNDIENADQFSLIKNISLNLPLGVFLYVKVHPSQSCGLGLDYEFFKKLQTIQNIRIIHKDVNVYNLIERENCLAVVVISGTLGLEASLRRKHVFIFGNIYYDIANCFIKPKSFEDFFLKLKQIIMNQVIFDEKALYSVLKAIDDSVIKTSVDLSKIKNTDAFYISSFGEEMLIKTIKKLEEYKFND